MVQFSSPSACRVVLPRRNSAKTGPGEDRFWPTNRGWDRRPAACRVNPLTVFATGQFAPAMAPQDQCIGFCPHRTGCQKKNNMNSHSSRRFPPSCSFVCCSCWPSDRPAHFPAAPCRPDPAELTPAQRRRTSTTWRRWKLLMPRAHPRPAHDSRISHRPGGHRRRHHPAREPAHRRLKLNQASPCNRNAGEQPVLKGTRGRPVAQGTAQEYDVVKPVPDETPKLVAGHDREG